MLRLLTRFPKNAEEVKFGDIHQSLFGSKKAIDLHTPFVGKTYQQKKDLLRRSDTNDERRALTQDMAETYSWDIIIN